MLVPDHCLSFLISRYSIFGLKKTTTAFCLKKKKKKTAEVGFLGSFSQTRRKCIYERWTTVAGVGEGTQTFLW